jgi:hypothetical protein
MLKVITKKSLLNNIHFKKFKRYVNNYWRPNTEAYIKIDNTNKNNLIDLLKHWFDNYPNVKVSIGPYKDIFPYSYHPVVDPNSNKEHIEFLFLYDSIIKENLKTIHFTIGREDFVEL